MDIEARIVDEEPHFKIRLAAVVQKFRRGLELVRPGGMEGVELEAHVERFARVLRDF